MKKVLLVVEDNDEIRELFVLALEPLCQAVHAFASARSALAFLQESRVLPDLAIVDLMMPEMSGFEFVRILKNDPHWRNIFVVLCSGSTDLAGIQREVGADAHLRKPVNLTDLERLCGDAHPLENSA